MDITRALHGKTIHLAHTENNTLIIQCDDGTSVHIEWKDGFPVMVKQDVRVVIPLPPEVIGVSDMGA